MPVGCIGKGIFTLGVVVSMRSLNRPSTRIDRGEAQPNAAQLPEFPLATRPELEANDLVGV
jgi:hypothetical protein